MPPKKKKSTKPKSPRKRTRKNAKKKASVTLFPDAPLSETPVNIVTTVENETQANSRNTSVLPSSRNDCLFDESYVTIAPGQRMHLVCSVDADESGDTLFTELENEDPYECNELPTNISGSSDSTVSALNSSQASDSSFRPLIIKKDMDDYGNNWTSILKNNENTSVSNYLIPDVKIKEERIDSAESVSSFAYSLSAEEKTCETKENSGEKNDSVNCKNDSQMMECSNNLPAPQNQTIYDLIKTRRRPCNKSQLSSDAVKDVTVSKEINKSSLACEDVRSGAVDICKSPVARVQRAKKTFAAKAKQTLSTKYGNESSTETSVQCNKNVSSQSNSSSSPIDKSSLIDDNELHMPKIAQQSKPSLSQASTEVFSKVKERALRNVTSGDPVVLIKKIDGLMKEESNKPVTKNAKSVTSSVLPESICCTTDVLNCQSLTKKSAANVSCNFSCATESGTEMNVSIVDTESEGSKFSIASNEVASVTVPQKLQMNTNGEKDLQLSDSNKNSFCSESLFLSSGSDLTSKTIENEFDSTKFIASECYTGVLGIKPPTKIKKESLIESPVKTSVIVGSGATGSVSIPVVKATSTDSSVSSENDLNKSLVKPPTKIKKESLIGSSVKTSVMVGSGATGSVSIPVVKATSTDSSVSSENGLNKSLVQKSVFVHDAGQSGVQTISVNEKRTVECPVKDISTNASTICKQSPADPSMSHSTLSSGVALGQSILIMPDTNVVKEQNKLIRDSLLKQEIENSELDVQVVHAPNQMGQVNLPLKISSSEENHGSVMKTSVSNSLIAASSSEAVASIIGSSTLNIETAPSSSEAPLVVSHQTRNSTATPESNVTECTSGNRPNITAESAVAQSEVTSRGEVMKTEGSEVDVSYQNIPKIFHLLGPTWLPSSVTNDSNHSESSANKRSLKELQVYVRMLNPNKPKRCTSEEFCAKVVKDYLSGSSSVNKTEVVEVPNSELEMPEELNYQDDHQIVPMDISPLKETHHDLILPIESQFSGSTQKVLEDVSAGIEGSEYQNSIFNEQVRPAAIDVNLQNIGNSLTTETLQSIIETANKSLPAANENMNSSQFDCDINELLHKIQASNIFKNICNLETSNQSSPKPLEDMNQDLNSDDSCGNDNDIPRDSDNDDDEKTRSNDENYFEQTKNNDNVVSKENSDADEEHSFQKGSLDKKSKHKLSDTDEQSVVIRKKSRYELIMERKEREAREALELSSRKNKVDESCEKPKCYDKAQKNKLADIFHPAKEDRLPKNKSFKCTLPKKSSNIDKSNILTSSSTKNKTKQKSKNKASPAKENVKSSSEFSEMESGNRFKNRNSSLFEEVTKVVKNPVRPKVLPNRQKVVTTHQANMTNIQPSIEELHAQVLGTEFIAQDIMQNEGVSRKRNAEISDLSQKRTLSLSEYKSRKPFPPSPQVPSISANPVFPNIFPPKSDYPVLDPRLTRGRIPVSINKANSDLSYIQAYQGNASYSTDLSSRNSLLTPSPPLCTVIPNQHPWNVPKSHTLGHGFFSRDLQPGESPIMPQSPSTPPSDAMDLCENDSPVQYPGPQSRSYLPATHFSPPKLPKSFNAPSFSPALPYSYDPKIPSRLQSNIRYSPKDGNSQHQKDLYDAIILPKDIRESVGERVISSTDALMLILSWIPTWLKEVEHPHQHTPPPVCGKVDFRLQVVILKYHSMTQHFNIYFPLLMHDLFYRILESWKTSVRDLLNKQFECDIVEKKTVGDMMEFEAKLVLPKKLSYRTEGQLAIITCTLKNGRKKDSFAYIDNQKISYEQSSDGKPKEVLKFYMKTMFSFIDLDRNEKITLLIVYPLSKALSQVRALSSIDDFPLRDMILDPCEPYCSKIVLDRLGTVHSTRSVSAIQETVKKIKDKIAFDEPDSAKMLLVDSQPGSDLTNIIITLCEDVKRLEKADKKHRILLCCRNSKRLEDIGLRLIATGDEESSAPHTVILSRSKNINSIELRKLTLEEQVSKFIAVSKEKGDISPGMPSYYTDYFDNEDQNKFKKQVLQNCDIVLTHVLQCHDSDFNLCLGNTVNGVNSQFSFCILDEAYCCTEPESLLPLLYGIRKFILAGDPACKPRPISKICCRYSYYFSFAARVNKVIEKKSAEKNLAQKKNLAK